MPSALDHLASVPPPDRGGPIALNRLDYQRDWTLCLLMRLHVNSQDYLVVCDYHDDVLVLDKEVNPTSVDFFQIKTTSGRWTVDKLLRQEAGQSGLLPSVLGKLYKHRIIWGSIVRSLNFVASSGFRIQLADPPESSARTEFSAETLHDSERNKVCTKLKAELALGADPLLDATLLFQVPPLTVSQHDAQTKGHLADFLEEREPSVGFPVSAIYRAIADEIGRKQRSERHCTTAVDLSAEKAISRAFFENFLQRCVLEAHRPNIAELCDELSAALTAEGVSWAVRKEIAHELRRHHVERRDAGNIALRDAAAALRDAVTQCRANGVVDLWALLSQASAVVKGTRVAKHLTDNQLLAIAAWEALNAR